MLFDLPSHKVEQQRSFTKWKWHICDWAQTGPEGTSKLHAEVDQRYVRPTPAVLPSLSQSAHVIGAQLTERRLGPGLQMILHNMQEPCENGQLQLYSPSLGHP